MIVARMVTRMSNIGQANLNNGFTGPRKCNGDNNWEQLPVNVTF